MYATSPLLGVKHLGVKHPLFPPACLAQLGCICDAASPAVKHRRLGGCTVKARQCSGTGEFRTQHPTPVLSTESSRVWGHGCLNPGGQKPQSLLQEG